MVFLFESRNYRQMCVPFHFRRAFRRRLWVRRDRSVRRFRPVPALRRRRPVRRHPLDRAALADRRCQWLRPDRAGRRRLSDRPVPSLRPLLGLRPVRAIRAIRAIRAGRPDRPVPARPLWLNKMIIDFSRGRVLQEGRDYSAIQRLVWKLRKSPRLDYRAPNLTLPSGLLENDMATAHLVSWTWLPMTRLTGRTWSQRHPTPNFKTTYNKSVSITGRRSWRHLAAL